MADINYPARNLGPGDPWGRQVEGTERRLNREVSNLRSQVQLLQTAQAATLKQVGNLQSRVPGTRGDVRGATGFSITGDTDPKLSILIPSSASFDQAFSLVSVTIQAFFDLGASGAGLFRANVASSDGQYMPFLTDVPVTSWEGEGRMRYLTFSSGLHHVVPPGSDGVTLDLIITAVDNGDFPSNLLNGAQMTTSLFYLPDSAQFV